MLLLPESKLMRAHLSSNCVYTNQELKARQAIKLSSVPTGHDRLKSSIRDLWLRIPTRAKSK